MRHTNVQFYDQNNFLEHFQRMNSNHERCARIKRMVPSAFGPYREIYAKKNTTNNANKTHDDCEKQNNSTATNKKQH